MVRPGKNGSFRVLLALLSKLPILSEAVNPGLAGTSVFCRLDLRLYDGNEKEPAVGS